MLQKLTKKEIVVIIMGLEVIRDSFEFMRGFGKKEGQEIFIEKLIKKLKK